MFETARAQSIGLFQSPSLMAVERMLSLLAGRSSGLDRLFFNRQESFVDRVFSRHFDAIGLPEWRQAAVPREVPAAEWKAASNWVSAPRDQRPQVSALTKPTATTTAAVTAAARAARAVPAPQRPTAVAPVGLPIVAPDASPVAVAARPIVAPVTPTAAPSVQGAAATAAAASRPPMSTQATLAPSSLAAPLPADAPLPLAALDSPTVVPSVRTSESAPVPETASASVSVSARHDSSQAPVGTAAPTADAVRHATPAVAPPTAVGAVQDAAAAVPAAPVPEVRVRDLLPQTALAAPAAVVSAPSQTRAKSFQHLSWADAQLSRSPWWRAAALPSLVSSPAQPLAQPAMPMLQTPELAAPARARSDSAPGAAARISPSALPLTASAAKPVVAGPVVPPPASPSLPTGVSASAAPASSSDAPNRLAAGPAREVIQTAGGTAVPSQLDASAPAAGPPSLDVPASDAMAAADMGAVAPISIAAPSVAPTVPSGSRVDSVFVQEPAAAPQLASSRPARAVPRSAAPAAPTLTNTQLLRVDPGLVPQQATPELAHVLAGAGQSLAAPTPISWAQPGGIWSQPAWAPTGILARMAIGPLSTQLSAWRSAPGVASSVLRSVAHAGSDAQMTSPAALLARPWVAPDFVAAPGPRRMSEVVSGTARDASPAAVARPGGQPRQSPPAVLAPAPTLANPALRPAAPMGAAESPTMQPWREAGGVAALAELFAAGVGLGSAASASYAQLESGAARPTLVADWLGPLLTPSTTQAALAAEGVFRRPAPVGQSAVSAPSGLARSFAPQAELPRSAATAPTHIPSLAAFPFVPAASDSVGPRRTPASASSAAAQPLAVTATSPRSASAPVPSAQVRSDLKPSTESAPYAAWPGSSVAPLFPALPVGGLGLLAQRFAGEKTVRMISSGLPLVAEAGVWAAAPGLPVSLQRDLLHASPSTTAPQRTPPAALGLPYLNVLPRASAEVASRSTAGAPTVAPQLSTIVSRSSASTLAPRVESTPGQRGATTSPAVAAPWFAPGGGGTLAELFATGIATTSGASAWLSQLHEQAPHAVVPAWIGSWLAAQSVGPASAPPPAAGRTVAPGLQYLGAEPARPSIQPSLAHAGPGPASTAVPAAPSPVARMLPPQPGMASVRAEQFASQQGLVAPQAGPGQWAPVAGGLVWLPTPAAPGERGASGTPPARPMRSAALPGAMGLRSELFVRDEQARVLGPGERMVSSLGMSATAGEPASASETPKSTAARLSRGGQMMYLPAQLSPATARAGVAAQPASRGAHVSPLELARPWSALPSELRRLGLPTFGGLPTFAGLQGPGVPSGAQARSVSGAPAAPARATFRTGGVEPMLSRMPVLAGDSLRSEPEVRLVRSAPAPRVVGSQRPYELAARFAQPMLTAFPPAERLSKEATQPEGAKPQMLWPQAAAVSHERIQRVLAMLPAVLPATGPLAALGDLVKSAGPNTGMGMPLWQRLPSSLPSSLPPVAPPLSADSEENPDHDGEDPSHTASGPEMTLIQGDSPARLRRRSEPATRPLAAKPANPPAAVEVFKAALAASGASREHVEASAKLMQVIQGQGGAAGSRGDDRLSLDDLTLVAISMGQGRMAAAGAAAGTPSIPSVEAAIGLPPAMHPTAAQDDREVRRKLDQMAKHVVEKLKDLKNNNALRGGFDS